MRYRRLAPMDPSSPEWDRVLDADFSPIGQITEKRRENIQRIALSYGGNARLSMGRIWTNKSYETRRKKVLSTPLP